MPASPAFEANPLSLSMSDEHVQRELWAATSAAKRPAAQPPSGAATRRMRRGRSLSELTVDDLLKKRRSWREFVGGMQPFREFALPKSLEEASYKLSENVYEFIGNYLLVALVCLGCVLYKRPAALIGIVVVSFAWDWQQKNPSPSAAGAAGAAAPAASPGRSPRGGNRSPRGGRAGGGGRGEEAAPSPSLSGWDLRLLQAKQTLVAAFTWLVLIASNVVPALALAAVVWLAAICLHGTTRVPVAPRGRLLR